MLPKTKENQLFYSTGGTGHHYNEQIGKRINYKSGISIPKCSRLSLEFLNNNSAKCLAKVMERVIYPCTATSLRRNLRLDAVLWW